MRDQAASLPSMRVPVICQATAVVRVLQHAQHVADRRRPTAGACVQQKTVVIEAQRVSMKELYRKLDMSEACVQQANELAAANAKYAFLHDQVAAAAAFLAGLLTVTSAQVVFSVLHGFVCTCVFCICVCCGEHTGQSPSMLCITRKPQCHVTQMQVCFNLR